MLSRRAFLEAGITAGAGLVLPIGVVRADYAAQLTPFLDPLTIPVTAQPTAGIRSGVASYELRTSEFAQTLHRELPPTTVWGYNGSFPGPTIEARQNIPIQVRWINDLRTPAGNLRQEHYLPVDTCVHGADLAGAVPRNVTHLHGGHTPPESDGYPENTIVPGQSALFSYPNRQNPTTLWYHDHALGITRLNMYMGLCGLYVIRGKHEGRLRLPAGEYELPLIIQDRSFNADGSLSYPGLWQSSFLGEYILVNGRVWPYHHIKPGKYRFRILNASNFRTYTFAFDANIPFFQIGSDGGLLEHPVPLTSLTLAPAERADVIVDFSGITDVVTLYNIAPAPYPGSDMADVSYVMQFRVKGTRAPSTRLPGRLDPIKPVMPAESVSRTRIFTFNKAKAPCTGSTILINNLHWEDITEFPRLNSTEIWQFDNTTSLMHPIHLHLIQFRILDIQPIALQDGKVITTGDRMPPPANEAGWKDTVRVNPGERVRIIARFSGYLGRYPYHCHLLEHEDNDMMRQFEVVSNGNPGKPFQSSRHMNKQAGKQQRKQAGDKQVQNRNRRKEKLQARWN